MANQYKRNQSRRRTAHGSKPGLGQKSSASTIRIVAGDWRGRKIPVIEADGLRPTGDRVRETLFNWLQMKIPGSRCLDLFAGSGALGLEAASRGAASVTLVESAPLVVQQIRQTLNDLGATDKVHLFNGTAQQYLATAPEPFDLVFVDPPFDLHVHRAILEALTPSYLASGALLYVELRTAQDGLVDELPKSLTVLQHKRFGNVTVLLLRFTA